MILRRMAAVTIAALTAAGAAVLAQQPGHTAPRLDCGSAATVSEKLPGGTRWQLCWHIDAKAGLVLEDVSVSFGRAAPLPVLHSIAMAQLNVPYDTGANEWNDITQYGFGGANMEALTRSDCPGGSRRAALTGAGAENARVLCVEEKESGPSYHLADEGQAPYTRQGHDLVLRTISQIGWYEYYTEYRLGDDGRVTARLGATGDLSPYDYSDAATGSPVGPGATSYAAAHYHNAFWRVDFALDGSAAGERVEQVDTTPTGRSGRRSAILNTTATPIATEAELTAAPRRWFRVVAGGAVNGDGHPRSYALQTGANDPYELRPEQVADLTVTQQKACEKFATFNSDPECPRVRTVLDYTNGEPVTDPVLWVRVGFHHIPRDEDQSPMPSHWQGFDLVPRDLTATNPLGPSVRASVNGQ
ncbi:copper amine oxidase [Actinoplanes sp. N902-109]|uniref:copper amine oxidase n=1 Tax=Actinoplanes sp. (strain N902-109) TaxID=649831 RepID=UPI00032956BF|nr:copper amine oxidase [Actinoplanes sp. N902-109]AGL18964.1 copper amine oxidase [Actinoplanes sp. N902-109]